MSEGKRPGGLTALAVLNFVFGGLSALGILAVFALIGAAAHTEEGAKAVKEITAPGKGILWTQVLLGLVTVGLMIASGVGYLGQKRFLGRTLGNAYAVCSLVSTGIGIATTGFELMSMVGLVYPVLTLALLNTTFKDDLVN